MLTCADPIIPKFLKKSLLTAVKLVVCFLMLSWLAGRPVQAQYYYQDICSVRNTMKEHRQQAAEGVRRIRIRSFDVYHALNKDFHCVKELSDDFRQVTTRTNSFQTGKSVVTAFFDDSGRIVNTIDSTAMSVNKTYYYYDKKRSEQIDSLLFMSYAVKNKDTFVYQEAHIYQYNDAGRLLQMLRRKSNKPYSTVTFDTDSSGRVIKESGHGRYDTIPPVYYKYNALNQLTDIFHYNPHRQKMEPDYLFDYDAQNRLSEKTTVTMNTNDYLLWKYFYNDKGLVAREECYGKKHALLGTLEFEYSY